LKNNGQKIVKIRQIDRQKSRKTHEYIVRLTEKQIETDIVITDSDFSLCEKCPIKYTNICSGCKRCFNLPWISLYTRFICSFLSFNHQKNRKNSYFEATFQLSSHLCEYLVKNVWLMKQIWIEIEKDEEEKNENREERKKKIFWMELQKKMNKKMKNWWSRKGFSFNNSTGRMGHEW